MVFQIVLPDEQPVDVIVVAFDAIERVQLPHHLEQHPNHERIRKVRVQCRKMSSETKIHILLPISNSIFDVFTWYGVQLH